MTVCNDVLMYAIHDVLMYAIHTSYMYIHTCKMENVPLAWQAYLAYVSDAFEIERQAAAGCQKLRAVVREKWKKIEFENGIA